MGLIVRKNLLKGAMLLRLRLLGLMILIAGSFCAWQAVAMAQGTVAAWKDFSVWKEPQNAERVSNWVNILLVRGFQNMSGTDREELLAKTLAALKEIASDSNVILPTRYNAILAAGQLVSKEAVPGGDPPEAYPDALPYLVDLYQQADTPHFLKYGALLGIVRHAICGIDPSARDQVIDLFLETITTEHSPGEIALTLDEAAPLDPAVWDWFRQTALEGLSALKTTGTDNNIVAKLLTVINGKSLTLEYFCSNQEDFTSDERKQIRRVIELASKAVKTLGDLDYKAATDIDAEAIVDAFVALVKAVCDVEHKMGAEPTIPMEQIVIDVKTCIQSVAWGIRCGFLTGRRGDNSLLVSLASNDPATTRLNMLMSEILELSAFLDEGDKTNKPPAAAILGDDVNATKRAFKFDLSELSAALEKSSQALAKMQRESVNGERVNGGENNETPVLSEQSANSLW